MMSFNLDFSKYNDGSLEYRMLTEDYLEDGLSLISDHFLRDENMCRTIGVVKNPKAVKEIVHLARISAKDGVSVIAVEKSTEKLVGVLFNQIQPKVNPGETTELLDYWKSCKEPETLALLDIVADIEERVNLYEKFNVDCLLETFMSSILPEYRGKRISTKLHQMTEDIVKTLWKGVNVKQPIDEVPLSLEPVPKMITALFTTFITQKIGEKMGFQPVVDVNYTELSYKGKCFAESISNTQFARYAYLILD